MPSSLPGAPVPTWKACSHPPHPGWEEKEKDLTESTESLGESRSDKVLESINVTVL